MLVWTVLLIRTRIDLDLLEPDPIIIDPDPGVRKLTKMNK
jgi:hypothetical protein